MIALTLFLLFTVVPAVELWLLIEIGQVVGGWQTVAWVVTMGAVGAWLGKRAGFRVLEDIFTAVREGRSPADAVVEAGLVLVGAVLLVTPGVLTDLSGALLFIGPLRRFLAPRVKTWLLTRVAGGGLWVGPIGPGPAHPSRQPPPAPRPGGFDHPTV